MKFFVKRVFGRAPVGDSNWLRKCAEQKVDPYEVFEARHEDENEFRVKVGESGYNSSRSVKTFEFVNPLADKKLKDYL